MALRIIFLRGTSCNKSSESYAYLGIEFVKDVFEVVSFDGLFGVEELEELLHELGSHVDFERLHVDCLVDHQLQEELVNALQVWPSGVHLILLLNTCLREAKISLFHIRKRAENILLDHLHDLIKVWNDKSSHILLI